MLLCVLGLGRWLLPTHCEGKEGQQVSKMVFHAGSLPPGTKEGEVGFFVSIASNDPHGIQ